MSTTGPPQKGTYGEPGLPLAGRYLIPGTRRRMLLLGGVLSLVVVGLAAADFFTGGSRLLSNGPLSSAHAGLEADCGSCHDTGGGVADERCSSCHERHGDRLGVYTYAAHYLYRSGDFQRLVPSPDEVPCAGCHSEHLGRHVEITAVADALCIRCHDFGSFASGHPELAAASGGREEARLAFTHVRHVREVMKRQGLTDVEQACLHCHHPQPDGRLFEPIRFDGHCEACHLTATTATPQLPLRTDQSPGVESLESLQRSGELGTRWAYFMNPGEFRSSRTQVRKSPVYHRDPWILANLRRLRQSLYPDAGLADLLDTSADVEPAELASLYREAIDTLRERALELRAIPDRAVQRELRQVESELAAIERRLEDPYTPLDETAFPLALGPTPAEDDEAQAAIEELAAQLTEPCRECHQVRDATIVRVQKNQRMLPRAEFDHRAHIIDRRCLDCHDRIPIAELVGSSEPVAPEVDSAAILNLPGIATCRECHNPRQASSRCVTCHLMHPNREQRSELLLYLE